MRRGIALASHADFAGWRAAARDLLRAGVAPDQVDWCVAGQEGLFAEPSPPLPPARMPPPRVPPGFLDLAEAVICHNEPGRFALLYRLLARLQVERGLLAVASDIDVAEARRLEKAVRRDSHKMTAFVRFREVAPLAPPRRCFVAWFEPEHHVVALTAPFFARRFADMDWMILTPKGAAALENGALTLSAEPARRPDLEDATDALWRTYYASIFNPARLKVKAMQAEMPKKYWKNLPEAALIPDLVAGAAERVRRMAERQPTPPPAFHDRIQARRAPTALPAGAGVADSLASLRQLGAACVRCPLHAQATQAVAGEGPAGAALMLVGEQPGDHEDLAGRPFVGPAGRLLDEALTEAGIERAKAYVTNAVKHFKHVPRGKRRLHQTPTAGEVEHCRWWLDREIALVRPRVLVALGATALRALLGPGARFAELRDGAVELAEGRRLVVAVHPAYLLRLPEPGRRREETLRFHETLRLARRLAAEGQGTDGAAAALLPESPA